jgi:hypothetical protein
METLVAIGNGWRYLRSMRGLVVALALLVGFTAADAKEADLVKLRAPAAKAAAKPAAKKSAPTRAKKKPQPVRKTLAKPKPKPKQKAKAKAKDEAEEVRLRPMP